MAWRVVAYLSLVTLACGGCAQATFHSRPGTDLVGSTGVRIVLVPVDIELFELTAGGLLEPKAEWTETARRLIQQALRRELEARRARLVPYQESAEPGQARAHIQLLKLHEAVAAAIAAHQHNPRLALPTKKGELDWALGPGVSTLREDHEADYALFVVIRDSYASTGRAALIVGAALLGVGLPGGVQVARASLVDLRSGHVIWFNRMVDPTGDLRTAEPARRAAKRLLDGFPW